MLEFMVFSTKNLIINDCQFPKLLPLLQNYLASFLANLL